MSDLIRRADLVKHLDDVRSTPPELQYVWPVITAIKCFVEEMPTIDAVPVVHGRWAKVGKHDWRCSSCKIGVPYSYTGFHYCPNCGARMDGGTDV